MKKSFWFFSLALLATALFVEYDLTKRTYQQAISSRTKKLKEKFAGEKIFIPSLGTDNVASFDKQFSQASAELSDLKQNPEKTEQKIKRLAASLTPQNINRLFDMITDKNNLPDQRTLAVELLSRHQSVNALVKLENFIKQRSNSVSINRDPELESVLRVQAVEGIASFPQKDLAILSLSSLDPVIGESFLKDRIRKSVAHLKNQSSSEKQENESLNSLVE